jgi:hypothetical protein
MEHVRVLHTVTAVTGAGVVQHDVSHDVPLGMTSRDLSS